MRTANIFRLEKSDDGYLGSFVLDGQLFCSTLEHPELAIPPGRYQCQFLHSPKFDRYLYELIDTPNRTEILLHVGNTLADTEGCILLGKYPGQLGGGRAVVVSAVTLDDFHSAMDCEDLILNIFDFTGLCS